MEQTITLKQLSKIWKQLYGENFPSNYSGIWKELKKVSKPTSDNIVRFLDVTMPMTLVNKLGGMAMYTDNLLKEHLYDINDVYEKLFEWRVILTEQEKDILEDVRKKCDKYKAAYFRVIF